MWDLDSSLLDISQENTSQGSLFHLLEGELVVQSSVVLFSAGLAAFLCVVQSHTE